MATKFYAVKKGRTPGIYTTWTQCKAQVDGFSGAVYKSFPTKDGALSYMNTDSKDYLPFSNEPLTNTANQQDAAHIPFSDATHAVAYVDGSYHNGTKQFSYGAVIFWNGEEFHLSQMENDPELTAMRNVAGEIHGSMAAMAFALEKGCTELVIYHDYAGIAHWPLKEWKANKEGTANYVRYYDSIKERLTVHFVKVKGHSNDYYNDLADSLAKEALGL
jgi:ribonuclease HI